MQLVFPPLSTFSSRLGVEGYSGLSCVLVSPFASKIQLSGPFQAFFEINHTQTDLG